MKSKKGGANNISKFTTPFVWYQIISSLIVAFILLGLIIYFNFFYRKNHVKVTAKVLNQYCKYKGTRIVGRRYSRSTKEVHDCLTDIKFDYRGVTYEKEIACLDKLDKNNNDVTDEEDDSSIYDDDKDNLYDDIDIEFDPNNIDNVKCYNPSIKIIKILLYVFFTLSMLTAGYYYFFRKNTFVGMFAVGDTMRDF